ncbi:LysR family transcriptional regulator [Oxalobacteraceae bacterium OM1]|nr:LysR family transcriptional regulator [Oxalobacteraceae bacterium OM1]
MDRLQSMRVFAKVVEQGSFAGAAQVLDLSNAAVTRLVADLEEHLGTRLLNRTTRRLSLTETGSGYLTRVLQILREIDDAEASASAHAGKAAGTLRIYTHPGFQLELAKLLRDYADQYPEVVLDITASDKTPDLVAEGYDVGVYINFQKFDAGMIARQLANASVLLTASPEYIARHGAPESIEDIAKHACLSFSYSQLMHGCPSQQGVPENERPPVRSRVISNSGDLLREAALAGMGLMFRPSFALMDDIRSGRLVRLLPDRCLGKLGVSLVYPSRRMVPAKVRSFLNFMVERFPSPDADPWLGDTRVEEAALAA